MSQPREKDNFKAVLVGIFIVASIIGLLISTTTNKSAYTIENLDTPEAIIEVNKLGNGAISFLVNNLSDNAKINLSLALLDMSSAPVKVLYAKTTLVMRNFPESKNPLEYEGYISTVFDAVTASTPINNIKSVTNNTNDEDIAIVKFILALRAETTPSTTDNIQISKDNNPNESALGVFFNDMLIPHRGAIRVAIAELANQEFKTISTQTELSQLIGSGLISGFKKKSSSITRHVLSSN